MQPTLFQRQRISTEDLSRQLVNALRLGSWRKREELARQLGVDVRLIRDAASHSGGHIISGQRGMKLTVCATAEEMNEAIGRARSQIAEMQRGILEREAVWHSRCGSETRRSA